MPSASPRRKAFQFLLLCTSFWALSFPAMKTLALTQQNILPDAGSWFLSSLCVTCRFLLAGGLLLLIFFAEVKTSSRREIEQGLWLALFAAAGICLQMDGLAYVSASTSAFLTPLYCVLIPLWVAVSRRRPPSAKMFLCGALVLGGMAVLVKLNLFAIRLGRGELETLAASVMFAAQILCLEHPRYAANRMRCFTTVMLLATGAFAVPVVVATAPSAADCVRVYASVPACGLLAVIVLFCTIGAFLLMNRWQRHVTATEAGLVYCAEPVFVSALALFLPRWLSHWTGVDYPNEQLTVRLLVGGGLITAANVLLQSHWLEEKNESRKS
jgi:drug/metabolite transporter (DMT)-like permease